MRALVMMILYPILSWGWQKAIWKWREQAQGLFNNPHRQSRVPQFILDTKHPWIIENRRKLEQLPDAELYLCSSYPGSTVDGSRVSGSANNRLEIPSDLFNYLEIDNCGWPISRPGWPNAFIRAREIKRCPAAFTQVKKFKTCIRVNDGKYSDWDKRLLEPPSPPRDLLDLFADLLANMTSLETLEWSIPHKHANYFEERFIDRELSLPSVRTLETDGKSHFLLPVFSNITRLEYGSAKPFSYADSRSEDPELLFIQATLYTPNVTRLGITFRQGWDHSKIQELVSYMPGLESLGIRDGLLYPYRYNSGFDDADGSTLREFLQILGSLHNLTQLDLPPADELDVGFYGFPGCGNAYFGPGGRDSERRAWRDSLQAIERAATIMVEVLPRLTGFSIGGDQVNITRYDNGTSRASFPWTGRIDEYVMELLPGGPDGPDW